jgi:hypothetical protein
MSSATRSSSRIETDDDDRIQALDRTGRVRAEDIAGAPQAMNEDYLVSCAEERAKCGFHAAESDSGLDRRTAAGALPLTLSDPASVEHRGFEWNRFPRYPARQRSRAG